MMHFRAAKSLAGNAIRKFIMNVAAGDSHPLPVLMHRYKLWHEIEKAEVIVVFPPRYTKCTLHNEFLESNDEPLFNFCRRTFVDILEKAISFIRVSLHGRGLCDLCFSYRNTVRTVSYKNLIMKAK